MSVLLALCAASAAVAQDAIEASSTDELTIEQVEVRPDLWPTECIAQRDFFMGQHEVSVGQRLTVVAIVDGRVQVGLPGVKGSTKLPAHDCDLLEKVRSAWSAMSPEQRALDAATLARRADLWPDRVRLRVALDWSDQGTAHHRDPGAELPLGTFDGRVARLRDGDERIPVVPMHWIDLFERARAALADPDRKPQHRVLRELEGKVVVAKTGKKARLDASKPPEYTVLYFSAGWCAPCSEFSPTLVDFYNDNKRHVGKRFQLIWISWDHTEEGMREYSRSERFPWLTVPWDQLANVPVTRAHDVSGIPSLVVLDRDSNVVVDSYDGDTYTGATAALETFRELLKK
ncbi:MAG: thioredoxin-like domain-containing protein [Planctomycetota bacterium]